MVAAINIFTQLGDPRRDYHRLFFIHFESLHALAF